MKGQPLASEQKPVYENMVPVIFLVELPTQYAAEFNI